jgi:hypothetical protein
VSDTYGSDLAPIDPSSFDTSSASFSPAPLAGGASASGLFQAAGGLGALGGLMQGISASIADGRKATALDRAALQSSEEAGVNAGLQLQRGDATAAQGAVRAAANGGGLTGSSMGVIANLSNQAMFNARAQIYRGNVERQNDLFEAATERAQGLSSLVGGVVSGATSLLGGFAQAAGAGAQAAALAA